MQWHPDLYEQFRRHRERPARDLMQQSRWRTRRVVYDLGCGTGRVTTWLADRYRQADIVGVDNSDCDAGPGRIARSSWQPAFREGRHRNVETDPAADVIFSNAAIHCSTITNIYWSDWSGICRAGVSSWRKCPETSRRQTIRSQTGVHDGPSADRLASVWTETRLAIPRPTSRSWLRSVRSWTSGKRPYFQLLEGPIRCSLDRGSCLATLSCGIG